MVLNSPQIQHSRRRQRIRSAGEDDGDTYSRRPHHQHQHAVPANLAFEMPLVLRGSTGFWGPAMRPRGFHYRFSRPQVLKSTRERFQSDVFLTPPPFFSRPTLARGTQTHSQPTAATTTTAPANVPKNPCTHKDPTSLQFGTRLPMDPSVVFSTTRGITSRPMPPTRSARYPELSHSLLGHHGA